MCLGKFEFVVHPQTEISTELANPLSKLIGVVVGRHPEEMLAGLPRAKLRKICFVITPPVSLPRRTSTSRSVARRRTTSETARVLGFRRHAVRILHGRPDLGR